MTAAGPLATPSMADHPLIKAVLDVMPRMVDGAVYCGGDEIVEAIVELPDHPAARRLAARYAAVVLRTAAGLLLCEVSVDRLRGWADEIEQEAGDGVRG